MYFKLYHKQLFKSITFFVKYYLPGRNNSDIYNGKYYNNTIYTNRDYKQNKYYCYSSFTVMD